MAYSLDDNWENGPMIRRAGVAAFGLYCACGLWITRHLTDGFVPSDVAAGLGSREWAAKLVDAGLWEVVEGGFHDPHYLLRNPSAEKVRERQKREAERKARWRHARAGKPASTTGDVPAGQDAGQDAGQTAGVPPGVRSSPPTPKGVGPRAPAQATGAERARKPENPDWRTLPAFAAAREPDDADRAHRGAAAARAQLRALPDDP